MIPVLLVWMTWLISVTMPLIERHSGPFLANFLGAANGVVFAYCMTLIWRRLK